MTATAMTRLGVNMANTFRFGPEEAKGRLVSRLSSDGDCWLWIGPLNSSGYGYLSASGRSAGVHRLALEWATGKKIPDGLEVDHLCFVRNCCNPDHLRIVTMMKNRRHQKRRPQVNQCASEDGKKCSACHRNPRRKGGRYCLPCHAKYMRACRVIARLEKTYGPRP